jgi:hypothetical protein
MFLGVTPYFRFIVLRPVPARIDSGEECTVKGNEKEEEINCRVKEKKQRNKIKK